MADSQVVVCPEPERWSDLGDEARRGDLEAHLDGCEDCRELVAALARTGLVSGSGPGLPFAPELAARGTRIGRYTIVGAIGAGGMGIVLAAHDPQLDRTVALKLVRVLDRSPAAIDAARGRLIDEARAMARLAHPNVVAVHEVVAAEDELFIAMERVDGPDLATWLATADRSAAERLRIVIGAGRGIAAAHAAGLVHRDIKPANILIGRDGRARLTDLGLASAIGSPASSRVVGTPGYIAPEVAAGGAADARSDQYAFAVTAWQALFGERPSARDRGRLGRVLSRAVAKAPVDRYPSVDALVGALERASRPRWPRVAVAGLAVVALALAAAWWRDRAPVTAACAGDLSAGGTWTVFRRAELASALAARDRTGRLAGRVVELVDARARDWSAAVGDVCTARARGTQSAELADRRGSCLEDQRRELDAVLSQIRDQIPVSRALSAVAHLPQAAACAEPPRATDDPAHRAVRKELAAISALRAAGKYAEAKQRLAAVHAPAGDLALAAQVAYRLGDLEMRTGNSTAALPLLHQAVADAERAHDDGVRLAAMIVLLQVLDDLGRATETGALAPLLEAAAERRRLDDGDRAMLENTLGNVAATAGKYAEAEPHFRAAIAATEREYAGLASPELAGALGGLGANLHFQAKKDEARALDARAIAMFEQTVGPDHPDLGMPLTDLATMELEDRDLDGAARDLERVIAIRTKALGADHPYLCEPTSMLGRVELYRGHEDRALELQRRSLAIAEHGFGPDHPLVAAAELHIAEILADRDEMAEAQRLAEASVKIWDASGAVLPEAFDAKFLLAQMVWDRDHARARALAEAGRAGYAALAPPYDKTAATIAAWLAAHPP